MNLTEMKIISFLLFLLCLLLLQAFNNAEPLKRVCYIVATKPEGMIDPSVMQWPLCTHVIYSFVDVDINTGRLQPQPILTKYIQQMNTTRPANVAALFSVGGKFPFARNKTKVQNFIDSAIEFCRQYNLNGLDVDWEFPSYTDDKDTFSELSITIRDRFDTEFKKSGKRLLFTVAITPILYLFYNSYDIGFVGSTVDFVNVMTYDYHSPNTVNFTQYNAPLFRTSFDILYFTTFNIDYSVNILRKKGLSPEKIILGMPFYGYQYILTNPQYHLPLSLTTGQQDYINYSDICQLKITSNATNSDESFVRVFDREAKVPYIYHGNKWITYDDIESITIKAQYVADNRLGGIMTFALNSDDVHNHCGDGSFPLQRRITDVVS